MEKKMNVFQYAANCEAMFESFLKSVGKERKTTVHLNIDKKNKK